MKLKKSLFNDRGSAIVEAVIVLPIVILAVLGAVMIVSYLTETVFSSVDMHRQLIREAGVDSGTRKAYGRTYGDSEVRDDYIGGKKCKTASDKVIKQGGLLFDDKLSGNIKARVYIIDEKKTTRYKDMFDEILF